MENGNPGFDYFRLPPLVYIHTGYITERGHFCSNVGGAKTHLSKILKKVLTGRTMFETICSSSITKRLIRSSLFEVRKNDFLVCSMNNLVNLVMAF